MAKAGVHILRTARIFIILSALFLFWSLTELISSLIAFEWQPNPFHWIASAYSVLFLVGVISGVGLLKRANWARISSIGLLGIGITYFALFIIQIPFALVEDPSSIMGSSAIEAILFGSLTLLAIGIVAWCAYTIRMLTRRDVRHEFGA